MRQSNNKKSRDVTAFLYERLSRDDNLEGESYSIGNQKKLLTKVAKEKGYCVGAIFIPDVFPLPAPQVSVNTRKGVVVNYAPSQVAV